MTFRTRTRVSEWSCPVASTSALAVIIVVAPRATVEPQLGALGLGAIEHRDAYGDVVAPSSLTRRSADSP